MVFSKLFFLYLFLPVCIIIYAASGNIKNKNTVLIIFSLLFYAWGEPVYVLLMLFSAFVNYLAALLIERFRGSRTDSFFTFLAVFYNLVMLGIFKYSGFIAENINAVFNAEIPVPDITLPIGISFYTFQNLSYIIDCHWDNIKAQKNLKKYLLYITLFPQLIAGPIIRYSDIENELNSRKTTITDISEGFSRIILGLSKKVIFADQLVLITNSALGGIENASFVGAWYGAAVYALQIYFDFSGYSDIAIGLGRIFGFRFNENFNHPFICRDITEFWQRWHISLNTFFRDYLLYIPIFGRRRKYGGLFLVWLCTGIWHGASWNFIIWGLYYGLFVFIEMQIGKKRMKKIPVIIRHIYSKLVIIIGFGIFYFQDMKKLGQFFKAILGFGGNGFITIADKISVVNNIYFLILAVICTFPIISAIKKLTDKHFPLMASVSAAGTLINACLLILCSLLLVDATTNMFLYMRF